MAYLCYMILHSKTQLSRSLRSLRRRNAARLIANVR
jgi:hypothetical protein